MKHAKLNHPLEKALQIAVESHAGQTDKSGQPYILHPLRLMMRMATETEKIVALLHDVVEDTPVTFDELEKMGFGPEVLEPLRLLTHDKTVDYFEYLAAIRTNPIARKVKLADLEDNLNILRLPTQMSDKDWQRLQKYRRAWEFLTQPS